MRYLFKTIGFYLFVFVAIVAIEALYFVWIETKPSDSPAHADVIVVFGGSSSRIKYAFDLAKQGAAKTLIVSPASPRVLAIYKKRYSAPENITYLLEEKAQTTFSNALYSSKLIREHHLSSVLLVTSDYHMPRSFLLLKLLSVGADCRIGMAKLDTWGKLPAGQYGRIYWLKLAYNEMVKVWGSLIEGGLYAVGGDNAWLRRSSPGITKWLRKYLLFSVPCPDCV